MSPLKTHPLTTITAALLMLTAAERAAWGGEDASPSPNAQAPSAPSAPSWRDRFDEARRDLVEGRFLRAEVAFRALALEAPSAAERTLADEMAHLASQYESAKPRAQGAADATTPARRQPIRDADELTLLYATSALYGAGTGAWFLLQTQPSSTLTAALPFGALTAAPILAVATVDGYSKLPHGLPHALSAGAFLGLQQGIWLVGYQDARARRIEQNDPNSSVHWTPETNATLLWGSATAGIAVGGLLGSTLETTPGRVSLTSSLTMWSGAILALGAGAVLPGDSRTRSEDAFLAGGAGTNAGLATGLLFAGRVSPSVARVRITDLLGIAGGFTTGGIYLAFAGKLDTRLGEGLTALGATAGLAAGWIVTSGMAKQLPESASAEPTEKRTASATKTSTFDAVAPSLRMVPGGATLGLGGSF